MFCEFRQGIAFFELETRCVRVFLLFAILSQTGCTQGIIDGGIFVQGRVYEWVNPPPNVTSRVHVDESLTDQVQLVPLAGVNVLLLHGGDYARQRIDETTTWKNQRLSDENGSFRVGGLTSPEKFHAAIRVRKDGFLPAEKVFFHDKLQHTAIVLTVRMNQNQQPEWK
jgi:hypothetical protein